MATLYVAPCGELRCYVGPDCVYFYGGPYGRNLRWVLVDRNGYYDITHGGTTDHPDVLGVVFHLYALCLIEGVTLYNLLNHIEKHLTSKQWKVRRVYD